MPEQPSPPTRPDPDAFAKQLGGTVGTDKPDPDQFAKQLGGRVGTALSTNTDAIARAAQHARHIGPRTWRDTMREVAATLPYVGGGVGGVVGGVGGAALGAAGGRGWETAIDMLLSGQPPPVTPTAARVTTPHKGAPTGPLAAGGREAYARAFDIGEHALTAGVIPEVAGRVIGAALKGGFMKPPAASIDAELIAADKALGLRIAGPELRLETTMGRMGNLVHKYVERGLTAALIGARQRGIGRAASVKGVEEGAYAFERVGAALGDVVRQGPLVDVLPMKVQMANLIQNEVFPKVLELYKEALPPKLAEQIQTATSGRGLAPALTRRLVESVRKFVAERGGQSIPTGTLDAALKILNTDDAISFEAATNLRTGMMEAFKSADPVMGKRSEALGHQVVGQITQALDSLSSDWTNLRGAYARGARGLEDKEILAAREGLTRQEQRDFPRLAKRTGPPTTPGAMRGTELDSFHNLQMISEALRRRGEQAGGWARMYEVLELAAIAGGIGTGHVGAAAGTAATMELLPGMITYAMYSPAIKNYMLAGFSAKTTTAAVSNLTRAIQAYVAVRKAADQQQPAQQAQSQPPPVGVR